MFSCYHVVPHPNVTVSVLDDELIIGEPLSLECNVTVARGVTSSVDIIWSVNGTDDRRVNTQSNDVYKINLTDGTTQYRDVCNITELKLTDNNTKYSCKAVINNTEEGGIDNVTVDNITLGKWLAN